MAQRRCLRSLQKMSRTLRRSLKQKARLRTGKPRCLSQSRRGHTLEQAAQIWKERLERKIGERVVEVECLSKKGKLRLGTNPVTTCTVPCGRNDGCPCLSSLNHRFLESQRIGYLQRNVIAKKREGRVEKGRLP